MCDPATIGLIVSAVGTGASAVSKNRMLKKQDQQAAAGIRKQSANQRESDRLVNQQIRDLDANTGASERAASLQDFQSAIRGNRSATEAGLDDPNAIGGDRFTARAGDASNRLKTAGQAMAERLSTIDGILRQRVNEGQDVGRLNVDLNQVRGNVAADDFLTKLRIAGERENPFVTGGAGLLQGFGSALSQRQPKVDPPTPQPIGRGN